MILRAAQPMDAGRVGEILGDFAAKTDWLPKLYSGAQDVAHAGQMIDAHWVTVACDDTGILGFIARAGEQVHALFVAAEARGKAVGQALLENAKNAVPTLHLSCFAANTDALRFYHRHGFAEMGRGDGTDNDEGLADVHLRWTKQPEAAS